MKPKSMKLKSSLMLIGGLYLGMFCPDSATAFGRPSATIPMVKTAPLIDGEISDGEWHGAVGFTGFMTPYSWRVNPYTLPQVMQPQVFLAYDDEMLYIALHSPSRPGEKNNPDGLSANALNNDVPGEIERDDHWELQFFAMDTPDWGSTNLRYRFLVNALGTFSDQTIDKQSEHLGRHKSGLDWNSGATVNATHNKEFWSVEMAIPLAAMKGLPPPETGTVWRARIHRGRSHGTEAEWNGAHGHIQALGASGSIMFGGETPAFQILDLGSLDQNQFAATCRVSNFTDAAQHIKFRIGIECVDRIVHEEIREIELAKGSSKVLKFGPVEFELPPHHSGRVVVEVETPTQSLYRHLAQFAELTLDRYRFFYATSHWPFDSAFKDTWELECIHYPYFNSIDIKIDTTFPSLPAEVRNAAKCEVALFRQGTRKPIRKADIDIENGKAELHWDEVSLREGEYYLRGILLSDAGEAVGKAIETEFTREKFPFEHNTIGKSDTVYPPFRAIRTDKRRATMSPWGRIYTLGPAGLPGDISTTDEQSMPVHSIAKPVRLEMVKDGQRSIITGKSRIDTAKSGVVQTSGTGKADGLRMEVKGNLLYEGWYEIEMSIIPEKPMAVDGVELVFPFGNYPDLFETWYQRQDVYTGALPGGEGIIWDNMRPSQNKRGKQECFFIPVFAFGNGDSSWYWYSDGDESWLLDYSQASQVITRDADGINLRMRLVNHASVIDRPLKFKFAVMANPSHPFPENYRELMWLAANRKVHDTSGYGYWGDGIDSITPGTEEDYGRLQTAVDQWVAKHRKQLGATEDEFIPVILYNSGEALSAAMEEYASFSGEWTGKSPFQPRCEFIDSQSHTQVEPLDRLLKQDWRSQPAKLGPAPADIVQSSVDARIWHYKKNMDKLGINGYWFDNAILKYGTNVRTDRAYRTEEGFVRPRYNTFAVHQLFRRLFVLYHEAGKIPYTVLNNHPVFCFSPWRWNIEGDAYVYRYGGNLFETVETRKDYDIISRIVGEDNMVRDPLAVARATYRLKPMVGAIKSNVMDYGEDGAVPGTRSIIGIALAHDFGVSNEYKAVHPPTLAKVTQALADFGLFHKPEIMFLPYWREKPFAYFADSAMVASTYLDQAAKKALITALNPTASDKTSVLTLEIAPLQAGHGVLKDAETGEAVTGAIEGGVYSATFSVPARNYRLLIWQAAE